jgi:hypothetical protein
MSLLNAKKAVVKIRYEGINLWIFTGKKTELAF